jgi:hypothetical protein
VKENTWQTAICEQLGAANEPLSITELLTRIIRAGFQHRSRQPRATLAARVAELVKEKRLEQVGRAKYQLVASSQEISS